MNTLLSLPNTHSIYNVPEGEEGTAQIPKHHGSDTYLEIDDDCIEEHEDEHQLSVPMSPSMIKTSIKFKKPSNETPKFQRINSYELETQCDTSESESDDEDNLMTSEQAQIAEEQYLFIMERAYYLVRETKESRHRTLLSPIVLRHKLYEMLAYKTTPVQTDMLFEEANLAKNETLRGPSFLKLEETSRKFSKTYSKKLHKRRKTTKPEADMFSQLLNFLTKTNC